MPIFSKDHGPLVDFVKGLGYLDQDVKAETTDGSKMLTSTLDGIRDLVSESSTRPEYIIWGGVVALLMIIFTSKLFK
jgi:hypothetical protein